MKQAYKGRGELRKRIGDKTQGDDDQRNDLEEGSLKG